MSSPDSLPVSTAEQFVESAGIVLEELGLPRMAGRVLGWLLICEPAQQSAAQLAVALSASTGSISGSTRLLLQYGLLDKVAFPRDRRDYFLLRPGIWWQLMQQRLVVVHEFWKLAERGRAAASSEGARQRLDEVRDFYAYLEQAMQDGLARWQAARRAATS
jgi:hypothetical protein